MARLPDGFDLWVRKAKLSADPARQIDLVLGGLVAREELYFFNVGTREEPRIAQAEAPPGRCAVVFTDAGRVDDFLKAHPQAATSSGADSAIIASPVAAALTWCVESGAGLFVNPETETDAVVVSPDAVAAFVAEWKQRGGRQSAGFWIPNMTSEEEDFWQENGL